MLDNTLKTVHVTQSGNKEPFPTCLYFLFSFLFIGSPFAVKNLTEAILSCFLEEKAWNILPSNSIFKSSLQGLFQKSQSFQEFFQAVLILYSFAFPVYFLMYPKIPAQ